MPTMTKEASQHYDRLVAHAKEGLVFLLDTANRGGLRESVDNLEALVDAVVGHIMEATLMMYEQEQPEPPTLRDQLAMAALTSICGHGTPEETAYESYAYADAMLAARKKQLETA